MRIPTLSLVSAVFGGILVASACGFQGSVPSLTLRAPPREAGADEGGTLGPLEDQPPAPIAADQRRDAVSSPVVFDAERGGVWTANGDVGTISYVDVDTPRVVQEVVIGKDIRSIALSPDARWIAAVDRDGASVTLVDAESRVVRRSIPVGTHPRAAVWDATDPRWLYVSLEDDGAVGVIDRTLGVYAQTIPVGRLPAGLAVSRSRSEIYVTHRIDGRVTSVWTNSRQIHGEIPLADEPANPDPTVPQGKPFAFEGMAWAPDGFTMWLPHELLAPTHPIQFQRTLFPAVSVVDFTKNGAEVKTNPNDPNGVIAGRKLLFGAINVLDPTGNTSIFSQPCAAALHPNGTVAYAIACGSEDWITFDVIAGVAVDLLRDLPGDHPVGLTLDDTGQRAFVLSDQSHTLLRLDLAAGNPTLHVRLLGPPLSLVAKDPVDPELREGLKLFFRANAKKGTLATTGNDWMSCGGCHLDGFVSTNELLFEAAHVVDPKLDAQLGHVGLKDLFSTAPTPGDPSFNPHDVLVALLDQGGLAPDRTGQRRSGAIDPSAPTPEATLMATRIARVIARDLPVGPSWLLSPGDKPNEAYDVEWCGNCHKPELAAWKKSAHAHAAEDPMVRFGATVEEKARGPQYVRLCAGCHDPVSVRLGDTSLASGKSITCLGCHDSERLIRAGGNADIEARTRDWTIDHKASATASLERLRSPDFCGGCHQQFVPGTGLGAIGTLTEWQASPYASSTPQTLCVDCHMAKVNGVADHGAVGGNVYMGTKFGDAAFVDALKGNMRTAIGLTATRAGNGDVSVTVRNRGAGHSFPTGVTDIREPWVELQAVDGQGKVYARYGGAGADGLIPATAARFGIDIAMPDGTVLFQHELSESTRIPFERRVPAQGTIDVTVTPAATLPAGATELDAVLLYRNVRTPYFRAALGNPAATAPEIEVARVKVP